jgi:hypothetical protein
MQSFKLLGVKLDENLSFQTNTEYLISKLNRAIFMINRAKNVLPTKALLTLYHSLFHSHLLYCPTITGCATKSAITKILNLQKKVLRIITHSTYHAHTAPIFKELQILNIHQIIQKASLTHMHSIFHSYAPSSLRALWTRGDDRDIQYNLRNSHDFAIDRCNYTFLENKPLFSLPNYWNKFNENKYLPNKFTFLVALDYELLPKPDFPIPFLS